MKQPEKKTTLPQEEPDIEVAVIKQFPEEPYVPGELVHIIRQPDWNRLGAALGINLKDTADLINHVEAMTHIKVEGVDIRLEPGLIHRLRSRCIRQDFNTFLKDVILKELHAWVGW